MAIKLMKKISRELLAVTPRGGKYRGRRVIVSIMPSDEISFRIKGTQQVFTMSLQPAMNLAFIIAADKRYEEQMDEYKRKKKAGYRRLRKPRKVNLPFDPAYFRALKH